MSTSAVYLQKTEITNANVIYNVAKTDNLRTWYPLTEPFDATTVDSAAGPDFDNTALGHSAHPNISISNKSSIASNRTNKRDVPTALTTINTATLRIEATTVSNGSHQGNQTSSDVFQLLCDYDSDTSNSEHARSAASTCVRAGISGTVQDGATMTLQSTTNINACSSKCTVPDTSAIASTSTEANNNLSESNIEYKHCVRVDISMIECRIGNRLFRMQLSDHLADTKTNTNKYNSNKNNTPTFRELF